MERRLYRDPNRRWIGGVCAGIAEYLAVPVFLVRLLTIPLLLSPLCPLTLIAYVICLFKIPVRETHGKPEDPEIENFRRSVNRAPAATFGQVRHRMREIEHRIRRMEAYVTSAEYEIDQGIGRRGPRPVNGDPA
ncbi:MAG: PspC domain-containing protein [Xanthomonadales bacterium]|nr:PspC domain-containing protein [Xanthomonadales bacterium]